MQRVRERRYLGPVRSSVLEIAGAGDKLSSRSREFGLNLRGSATSDAPLQLSPTARAKLISGSHVYSTDYIAITQTQKLVRSKRVNQLTVEIMTYHPADACGGLRPVEIPRIEDLICVIERPRIDIDDAQTLAEGLRPDGVPRRRSNLAPSESVQLGAVMGELERLKQRRGVCSVRRRGSGLSSEPGGLCGGLFGLPLPLSPWLPPVASEFPRGGRDAESSLHSE